jgi:class 3 adenylate cyclase/tetratricopeptide (TPR) repeat protein
MVVCSNCGEENPPGFKFCGHCGTQLASERPQEIRKTVTVYFSDLAGSTALGERLDSEALREVMTRYFDVVRAVIAEHGGTIEKFIGDAVMAVFGLPRVHEDDALRAVRAAFHVQKAVASLNDELERSYGVRLTNRTGLNTGEVVAGEPTPGQRLVTGDTVNVAARLEQAAPPFEVLLGEPTYKLVREYVDAEEIEPLELKGKSERVRAYRLHAVRELAETAVRAARGPLVGRESELEVLERALREALDAGRCRIATVVGEPGVGKSRLTDELLEQRVADARVLRCRCLPYGRGITFWPLVELVRDAASIHDTDSPATARAKLERLVPAAPDVRDRVASAVGLGEEQFPLDEIYWGTRKLLEALAATQPVVVHVEDIHSAEDAFLGLLEHVVRSAEAPILLLCTARPELLERRPDWSESCRLALDPLTEAHTAEVIERLLGGTGVPPATVARIVEVAEGNPLFAEHVVSMLIDDGVLVAGAEGWQLAGEVATIAIPDSIQAVLAARLEILSPEERALLEAASVAGGVFPRAALEAIVAEPLRPLVAGLLDALVERRLVQPSSSEFEANVYRFQHGLVRETAYRSLLKRSRASLHERFADWAERVNRDRERETEYAEILAYHLEQAHDYLVSLGPADAHAQALGRRAAGHLSAAGGRAFARGDMGAASNLLRRGVQLLPELDPARLELLPSLSEAMMETGEFAWAELFLDEASTAAATVGDARLEADAVLTRLLVQHHTTDDLAAWRGEVERQTSRLIPLLEGIGAHAELAKAWRMIQFVYGPVCQWGKQVEVAQRGLDHARLAGNRRLEARLASSYVMGLCEGPTPVEEAIARTGEIIDGQLPDRQAEAMVRCLYAYLLAMKGDFDAARANYRRSAELIADLAGGVMNAFATIAAARIELLASQPREAVRELQAAYDSLGQIGERYFRPLVGALLAHALLSIGEIEQASRIVTEAEEQADADDPETQALLRAVRSRLCASADASDFAVELAREAVELTAATDAPGLRAGALVTLAEVCTVAGLAEEAATALADARSLYEQKGNAAAAAQLRPASIDAADAAISPNPPS